MSWKRMADIMLLIVGGLLFMGFLLLVDWYLDRPESILFHISPRNRLQLAFFLSTEEVYNRAAERMMNDIFNPNVPGEWPGLEWIPIEKTGKDLRDREEKHERFIEYSFPKAPIFAIPQSWTSTNDCVYLLIPDNSEKGYKTYKKKYWNYKHLLKNAEFPYENIGKLARASAWF